MESSRKQEVAQAFRQLAELMRASQQAKALDPPITPELSKPAAATVKRAA
jgi:hypothetical protein